MYQVKYTRNNQTCYGIHREYDPKAKEYAAQGLAIVEDAIYPKSYLVPLAELTEIESKFGNVSPQGEPTDGWDEYHTYIQSEFKKAQGISDALPDGVWDGSLFSVGVADGSAWYEVTKVNKKTCKVEWRGFCGDRYTDHHFGWGGTFPINDIERYVGRGRALAKLFAKKV